MTQYDFIHKKLFPLLSKQTQNKIYNFTSSNFNTEQCIRTLIEYETYLQNELTNIREAINRLKSIKN